MKNILKTLVLASVVTVVATAAMAATTALNTLPQKGQVSVEGVVENLEGKNRFTLNDETGKVTVQASKKEYEKLRVGERVAVTGSVHHSKTGSEINASSVTTTPAPAAGTATQPATQTGK